MTLRLNDTQIHLVGKPKPKARPKLVRTAQGAVRIYTPTSSHEKGVAAELTPYKGRYTNKDSLYVGVLFHGANKKADLDNLVKLVLDALVKAQVISDDSKVMALVAERAEVSDKRNAFPGMASTTIRVGEWP